MTTVLIAGDKFKGSLTAAGVCDVIARAIRASRPDAEVISMPIADGGEGTEAAAISAGHELNWASVTGPSGQVTTAESAMHRDNRAAVIENGSSMGIFQLQRSVGHVGGDELRYRQTDMGGSRCGATGLILAIWGSALQAAAPGFFKLLAPS